MAPSSRMNLASLLQPDSDEPARRPSSATQPAPSTPYAPPAEPYSHSHPPSYPQPPSSSQGYSGSQYQQHYPSSQPAPYHQGHSYASPNHGSGSGHHSHQYHSHPHHHHVTPHPPIHPHPHLPHPHHHPHTHHTHHSHAHHHPPHAHVHVIHTHPPSSANPPSAQPPLGSPPYPSSHAFPSGPGSARGPQPIIPITPAPRSPVAAFSASRSPNAPYSIYGAGAALASGRRSPMPADYPPQSLGAPSSSSGSRRNTLSGPQAIEPVTLREYPSYPSGSSKHDESYPPPPAFSAPVYGSRPESPNTQTGGKSRRSGGGAPPSRGARSASTKRSIGGAGEAKRATSDRSRERENERDHDREREELLFRERERERQALDREQERARDREREHDEHARAARERDRDRDRERQQHEMEMRERRAQPPNKRLENEFARRPPSGPEWDRVRDRGRVPREQERDWRREDEERQGMPLQGKHLPPISAHPMPGYSDGSKHMHSHNLPPPLQPRPPPHLHHYHPQHASPPPPTLPPLLSPIWLGTHVYPNLPFPVSLPPTLSHNNFTPEGYKPYQYTILVPYGFLPLQPAARTPRPAIPLWGSSTTGYTDDSNLVLAAVHSGRTSWSDIRRARKLKQDAKIIVGVWMGGANGGRNAMRPKGGAWEGGQGPGQLFSSSWGNSHDGGGMEIVEVAWLEKGAAHAPHRPNRRERMEQYAQRRADLDLDPPTKRDRIDTWYLDSDDEDVVIPAKRTWDVGETIVFGKGGTTSGFVYDPHALRSVVFEESNERSTKRLKTVDTAVRRDIVLENDDEQYILTVNPGEDSKPRTYTLLTLSPDTKKTEVLRKSLTEQDVAFFDKGLCVWLKGDELQESKEGENVEDKMDTDTDRKGWFCHVNRWKFAADNVTTINA